MSLVKACIPLLPVFYILRRRYAARLRRAADSVQNQSGDDGAPVDSGKHDELLVRGGAYRRIWQSQDRMPSVSSSEVMWNDETTAGAKIQHPKSFGSASWPSNHGLSVQPTLSHNCWPSETAPFESPFAPSDVSNFTMSFALITLDKCYVRIARIDPKNKDEELVNPTASRSSYM